MPQKALAKFTNKYIEDELRGKSAAQKIAWLEALQAREEQEMKEFGSHIEWERQGKGLPHTVDNPRDTIAAIKRAMAKKGKGGTRRHRGRKTRSTRALTARRR
jgi:hypothetical protein